MKVTATQLAEWLQAEIVGDPSATVSRPMRIEDAGPGDFAFLDNPKYEHFAYSTKASILLVSKAFQPIKPLAATLLKVDDVRVSLAFLLEQFGKTAAAAETSISPLAAVDPSARIGQGVHIGPFAVIEADAVVGDGCFVHAQAYVGAGAQVGAGSVLHPGVRIMQGCKVGRACILHPNAVIGADGFGFAPQPDGSWKKVPQVGDVVIEDHVEIGASACIDRAALGSTVIRTGAKLDNLVHIAHNVEIGAHTAIAAQVGVAGSARVGAHCMLGGQAGIAGHISIADGTRLQAQSGVGSSIKAPGKAWFGSPAFDYGDFTRSFVVFKQLPELAKKVRAMEKNLQNGVEKAGE